MNQMRFKHSRRYVYVYYEGEGSEKVIIPVRRSRLSGRLETTCPG